MSVLIGHALGQNMNRTLNPQQRNCAFLATPDGRLIVVAYALKPTNTDKCMKSIRLYEGATGRSRLSLSSSESAPQPGKFPTRSFFPPFFEN